MKLEKEEQIKRKVSRKKGNNNEHSGNQGNRKLEKN